MTDDRRQTTDDRRQTTDDRRKTTDSWSWYLLKVVIWVHGPAELVDPGPELARLQQKNLEKKETIQIDTGLSNLFG